MELKIIIAGLGGQGVLFLTRLIAQTALAQDHPVMVSEIHGMSQRGGSVVSHLKIGGDQSPLILQGTADLLFGLERDEAVRNLPMLRKQGVAFVNMANGLPPEVEAHLERLSIEVHCLPAGEMAVELGSAAVTNVILVGMAAGHPAFPLSLEIFREVLAASPSHSRNLNLLALEAGHQARADSSSNP